MSLIPGCVLYVRMQQFTWIIRQGIVPAICLQNYLKTVLNRELVISNDLTSAFEYVSKRQKKSLIAKWNFTLRISSKKGTLHNSTSLIWHCFDHFCAIQQQNKPWRGHTINEHLIMVKMRLTKIPLRGWEMASLIYRQFYIFRAVQIYARVFVIFSVM